VVDDNLLSFADDKQGTILSKMLLESELKEDVFEPNFYFDKKEANSKVALDNLLLTSGWRRYTWKQVLNEPKPVFGYEKEHAIFTGRVFNYCTQKFISGAKITLKNSGKSVLSDTSGNFILSKFDIASDTMLEISKQGYETLSQQIDDYTTGYTFYVSEKGKPCPEPTPPIRPRPVYMMNERAGVMLADEVQLEAVVKRKDEKPRAENVEPKNLLPNENEQANAAGLLDEIQPNVGDFRFAAMKRAPDVKPEDQILYYRAKEFPQKVYSKTDSTRSDLQTTVYWNGHIETDQNGKAQIQFTTNDLISSFRATAEGFGVNGEIGRGEAQYSTNQLLVLDAKIPSEIVSGDTVVIPVFVRNNGEHKIYGGLSVYPLSKSITLLDDGIQIYIEPKSTQVFYVNILATDTIGRGNLGIVFEGSYTIIEVYGDSETHTSEKVSDQLQREINVVAKGFPANISLSGQDLTKTFSINPEKVVPNSMRVSLTAFPNVMTELLKGVEAILAEPHGCFEQTSSSNYPNIMVLDYMRKM
ncbi:MAG TPA: alpha-2-macroglobulin family protein, partial [Chitinophagales bacterium]